MSIVVKGETIRYNGKTYISQDVINEEVLKLRLQIVEMTYKFVVAINNSDACKLTEVSDDRKAN